MQKGYIKLWRRIEESFVWQDPEVLKLFLYLIMKANYRTTEFLFNGRKQVLHKGQLICGRKSLSLYTKINESKVYRSLKCLEIEQLIEQRKSNTSTIITIVCYDKYQPNEHQNEQPVNNERTTSEQPVNTSKEYKHINNIKEYNNMLDLWNRFANHNNLRCLNKITKSRSKQISCRNKEQDFDFAKILTEAQKQKFCLGEGQTDRSTPWKIDFDWIIKNDTNYIKVLEGKYGSEQPKEKMYL